MFDLWKMDCMPLVRSSSACVCVRPCVCVSVYAGVCVRACAGACVRLCV